MIRSKESYRKAGLKGAKSRWSIPQSLTLAERFWIKVEKGDPDACWPWKQSDGPSRGMFRIGRKMTTGARAAYLIAKGPIPPGLHVCHKCDFQPCCNPAHLFLGTAKDNLQDAMNKGRTAIGEKHGNAKLKNAQIAEIRRLIEDGQTQRKIAESFGVSHSIISEIKCRKSWKHV